MLFIIDFTPAIYPALMLIIAGSTFFMNISITKKANQKFQKEQMDAKADVTFVKRENNRIEREFDLKLKAVKDIQEEVHATLEKMSGQIQFIYNKHFKD